MSIWKKLRRIKDVLMENDAEEPQRQIGVEHRVGKHRKIEFLNTRTDERVYYEEVHDGNRVVSTEGDPRLKRVMEVLDAKGGVEESMEDPEVQEAIAAAISEITGEDLGPKDVGFSVSKRRETRPEGWKKRALH